MRIVATVLIALLVFTTSLVGCIGDDSAEQEVSGNEQDILDIQEKIDELEQLNNEMNKTIEQLIQVNMLLSNQHNSSQVEISDLLSEIESIKHEITERDATIESIRISLEQSNLSNNQLSEELFKAQDSLATLEGNLANATLELSRLSNESNILDLSFITLSHADLSNLDFSNTNFTRANLSGSDLTGTILDNAILNRVTAINLQGCPSSLPENWQCLNMNLVGPSADLSYANLSGLNLAGFNLNGAILKYANAANLLACPSSLPEEWSCFSNTLLGPYANLDFANFTDVDLSNQNLTGVDLSAANLHGSRALNISCPSKLPDEWRCIIGDLSDQHIEPLLLGPYANLSGADLSNLDLSNFATSQQDCMSGDSFQYITPNCVSIFSLRYVDFSFANLTNAIATWGDFEGANLSHATLVNFTAGGLDGTDDCTFASGSTGTWKNANLSYANLTNATVTWGDFEGADLSHSILHHAVMYRSGFRYTNLSNIDFYGSDITFSEIFASDLSNSNMSYMKEHYKGLMHISAERLVGCPSSFPIDPAANFPLWVCRDILGDEGNTIFGLTTHHESQDLSYANLSNLYLGGAYLRTDLTHADLSHSYLGYAVLLYANLDYANLSHANLEFAYTIEGNRTLSLGIQGESPFQGWTIWGNTTCPDGTNSDNNGGTCVNNQLPD